MFIKVGVYSDDMKDEGIIWDMVAIPFWIILIGYSIYQIIKGITSYWLVLVIIGVALIVDSRLVRKYLKKEIKK